MGGGHRVSDAQLRPDCVQVRHAAQQLNLRAKRLSGTRWALALGLAALSAVAVLIPESQPYVAAAGISGALLISLVLTPRLRSTARLAALAQEMFDTAVLGLPWATAVAGSKLPAERTSSWARNYDVPPNDGDPWYPPECDDLNWPLNALVCQRSNLAWDIGQRRRWRRVLLGLAAGWIVLGLALGLALSWGLVVLMLAWVAPSLSAVLAAIDESQAHADVAAGKESLLDLVDSRLRHETVRQEEMEESRERSLVDFCRDVQDVIFRLRCEPVRVPEFFYRYLRRDYEQSMKAAAGSASQNGV